MITILHGDAFEQLKTLSNQSINCCITSPPYFGLRDYGVDGQIGLEKSPEEYVARLAEVFREVWRVLRDDGTLWMNLGDSYANDGKWGGSSGGKHAKELHGNTGIGRTKVHTGLKPKELIGIPWRVAFALQADGWYLRQDIIWHKPNPMPESVKDRCTKSHEYIFLFSKQPNYYFDNDAIIESLSETRKKQADKKVAPGNNVATRANQIAHDISRGSGGHFSDDHKWFMNPLGKNKRDVWTVSTKPYRGAHFAVFPEELIEPCVLAGCPISGTVMDPFAGSGTTLEVAEKHGRNSVGIEINGDYVDLINKRVSGLQYCLID